MQTIPSIGRAIYRIVFRSGSPQRIHYAPGNLPWALAAFIVLTIASQKVLFHAGYIEIGLFLFLALSGFYIAAALLTRRTPRPRLRLTMQAAAMILACAQLLLLLTTPLVMLSASALIPLSLLVALAVIVGISNCVQFALASSRSSAYLRTVFFFFVAAVLYSILRQLLQTVFS